MKKFRKMVKLYNKMKKLDKNFNVNIVSNKHDFNNVIEINFLCFKVYSDNFTTKIMVNGIYKKSEFLLIKIFTNVLIDLHKLNFKKL